MSPNIYCPGCGHLGRLPADLPERAVLTCHVCRVKFPAEPLIPPPEPLPVADGLGVWVGDAITTTPLPPGGVGASELVAPAPAPAVPVVPPPPVVTPQNAAAHLEWVRAEVEQFDLFVARQLALFQKMREQLATFESKARAEAVLKQQALDRDRAVLDARAKDLDTQEAKLSAALKLQAAELHAELERQVADEREIPQHGVLFLRHVLHVKGDQRCDDKESEQYSQANKQ